MNKISKNTLQFIKQPENDLIMSNNMNTVELSDRFNPPHDHTIFPVNCYEENEIFIEDTDTIHNNKSRLKKGDILFQYTEYLFNQNDLYSLNCMKITMNF